MIGKPIGLTSFQIVKRVRSATQVKRVGHAGTLDPFASGLLILAVGRDYTKHLGRFQSLRKEYKVTFVLGIETDTYDSYGVIKGKQNVALSKNVIETATKTYAGAFDQVPPSFSAKKKDGRKLYEFARKGVFIEASPQPVEIYSVEVDNIRLSQYPQVTATIVCSKGTYVRSWVHEIGRRLGVGAYTKDLIRTRIGSFKLQDAMEYGMVERETILRYCGEKSEWMSDLAA